MCEVLGLSDGIATEIRTLQFVLVRGNTSMNFHGFDLCISAFHQLNVEEIKQTSMKVMEARLKSVDCVIEVHDARISFQYEKLLIDSLKKSHEVEHVLFTDIRKPNDKGTKKILPLVKKLMMSSNRYNRSEVPEYSIMVIGVPNVGKSSLINNLRSTILHRRSASAVGSKAGVTKAVSGKIKVSEDPKIYLFDTPGILPPNIKNVVEGLKLAVCGTFQDHLIGEEIIADFLLYVFNKQENFQYVNICGLDQPTDDIMEFLLKTAVQFNLTMKVNSLEHGYVIRPNFNAAAIQILKLFREGTFGQILFDKDYLKDKDS
ncbi:Mitochondrial GTPase 1 [Nymphon striatum]|nr:Mitochondrial GTPase 1 [Nymphon striatum]